MKQILIALSCTLIASCAIFKPTTAPMAPVTVTKPCTSACNMQESSTCIDACSVTSTIESNTVENKAIHNATINDTILITSDSKQLKIGSVNRVNFTLMDKDNKQIKSADLQISHTQKIHIMIIDPTLTDYQHIHPVLVKSPDSEKYTFDFTPKSSGYIMWADITPKNGEQEYIKTTLGTPNTTAKPDEKINNVATVGNYKVNLIFESTVKKDGMTMPIAIITKKGKPVTNLEPIMGASAHIAVFANNGQTLIHTHPQENLNVKKGIISFHLAPTVSGYAKMFIQFKVGGTEYFAPFGFKIQE